MQACVMPLNCIHNESSKAVMLDSSSFIFKAEAPKINSIRNGIIIVEANNFG